MSEFFTFLLDIPYRWITILPDVFPILWAGAILGHSYIATPAKFKAKGLERPLALEVGRASFILFNRVEFLFLILITISLYFTEFHSYILFIYVIIAASFLIQRFFLRPALFQRVEQIQSNEPLPLSYHHSLYSILELIKFIALIGLGNLFITY